MTAELIQETRDRISALKTLWSEEVPICTSCFVPAFSGELAETGGLTLCCSEPVFRPEDQQVAIYEAEQHLQFLEILLIETGNENSVLTHFQEKLGEMSGDAKKRRKTYNLGRWPGKQGGKKRSKEKVEFKATEKLPGIPVVPISLPFIPPKPLPASQRAQAPKKSDGWWVSTVEHPRLPEPISFGGASKRIAQRQARSFIRTTLNTSITVADKVEHDEAENTSLVVFYA